MNKQIENNLVWRSGVVLNFYKNQALVRADAEDRIISIKVSGDTLGRRHILTTIRNEFEQIHQSIAGLEITEIIPIPNHPNAKPLDYQYLLQLERDGYHEIPVKDGNKIIKVDVRKILNGIETVDQRNAGINIVGNITDSVIVVGDENLINWEKQSKRIIK